MVMVKIMSDWIEVGQVNDIPKMGARVVKTKDGDIAVFRTAEDNIFALADVCPHKQGRLSQGLIFDNKVACPMHDWKIELESGNAVSPDEGCAATYPIKLEGEMVYLSLTANEGCPNE
jgi:nitrite reductase [NAD(P)H] small subunit